MKLDFFEVMAIASVVTFLLFLAILKLEGSKLDLKFLNKKEVNPSKEDAAKWGQELSESLSQHLGKKLYRQQNVGYVVCIKGSRVIGNINGTWEIHQTKEKALKSLSVLEHPPEGLEVRKITFDYIQH